jgi:hypothetical protein
MGLKEIIDGNYRKAIAEEFGYEGLIQNIQFPEKAIPGVQVASPCHRDRLVSPIKRAGGCASDGIEGRFRLFWRGYMDRGGDFS